MPDFQDKKNLPPPASGPGAGQMGSGDAPGGGDGFSKLTGPAGDWVGQTLPENSPPPIDRDAEQLAQRTPPQSSPGPGTTPFIQPAAAAGTAAGGMSWSFVIGALAVFAVGVVTVGSLGACLLAGVAWYAVTPSGPIDPAVEPLIAQLQSEDVTVRAQAADSLAGMGSGARNAVPELKKLLDDQDDSVRFASAKALANITGWSQSVKREVSRRFVGRTERTFGDRTEWEDEWEIQYKIETVRPGS